MKHLNAANAQIVRFVLSGVVNTATNFGMYSALVFAGVQYALANLIALIASLLLSFKTQSAYVFRTSGRGRFGRFLAVWAFIYVANTAAIKALLEAGLNEYLAGAVAIAPTVLLSYVAQRFIVYR